ncbi:MAG: bifunctional riboflavin kinase/FAD synthetase [Planctomycetaceae bacterium]|jgi:riboflavin kinase/FMN adenylyltransferase|nr:bifunctional riboflavin kinase/FAD synthetase [Planctomycetaceae bacterium]
MQIYSSCSEIPEAGQTNATSQSGCSLAKLTTHTGIDIFHNFESVPEKFHNGAVSVGKFDGVHLGHSLIFNRLKNFAARLSVPSVVVTFCPHPIAILRPDFGIRPIQTLARKIELIKKFDVDAVIVVHPDKQFLQQSAETFFFDILCGQLRAKVVVCGRNFTFGHDRVGTAESIKQYGNDTKNEIEIDIVEHVQIDGKVASSTLIRQLIQEGQIEEANKFLGLPYRLSGVVSAGDSRGRLLGFPTANLEQIETIIPQHGVYAAIANFDGKNFASTVSIGTNPTFNQNTTRTEVFLHDFNGDIYGKELHVDFLANIRKITKFNSKEELVNQIQRDITQSNKIIAEYCK